MSAPKGHPFDDDQQVGGTRSSAESTDCGSDGDEDGDDDEDDAKNEEKKRQRDIKRIVRQRSRKIEEKKDALRAMATLQLQAQPLPPRVALPEYDLIPLPSTTTDWERAADEVAKWVESTEDVHILQVKFDTEMKYGQSRRINSARLLKVKESFRRNGLLRVFYCTGPRDDGMYVAGRGRLVVPECGAPERQPGENILPPLSVHRQSAAL